MKTTKSAVGVAGGLFALGALYACASDAPALCDYGACGEPDGGPSEAGDDGSTSDSAQDGTSSNDAGADGALVDGNADTGVECDSSSALVCGGQCEDPSDPAHCGSCTTVCPAVTNGTATCSASGDGGAYACGFSCGTGYHACTGQCLPDTDDPSMDACVVSETFGVFVSKAGSDASGCGTRTMPCATIGNGITVAHAASKRVYVCDDGTYAEQIALTTAVDGAKVYGGLSCTGGTWAYDATKKPLVMLSTPSGAAACPSCALVATSLAVGATFADMAFQAPNGVNPGDSSIAVFANGVTGTLSFLRSTITAGNGVGFGATANGGTGSNYPAADTIAADGGAPSGASGAIAVAASCTSGASSGGSGGNGVVTVPPTDNGTTGTWSPAGTTSTGLDGAGGNGGIGACMSNPNPGANGAGGAAGAAPTNVGTLDTNGWHPTSGGAGGIGYPGQGGGGGGGETGHATGGGGGGAGGCGGGSGEPGSGGGSSIAVLSFSSSVTLNTCTLTTGTGGAGEAGGTGGQGQGGGAYATGTFCTGQYGGNGGGGGGGGGGAGGVSVGIVYKTTAPTTIVLSFALGTAGAAGGAGSAGPAGVNPDSSFAPGNPGSAGNVGISLAAEQTLALP